MQDKEVDQLFRSKLQNFEMEPSRQLWPDISAGINKGKSKPHIAWLGAAASLLLLLSFGIYFLQQKQVATPSGNVVVKLKPAIPAKVYVPESAGFQKTGNVKATQNTIAINKVRTERRNVKTVRMTIAGSSAGEQAKEELDVKTVPAPVVHQEILAAVVPDIETPLAVKQDQNISDFSTQPGTTLMPAIQQAKGIAAAPVKKHRIRSLGDLLNVVISKVDKRKDKIIEFTNTDDDESTVTGLNLGIIKIKRQE